MTATGLLTYITHHRSVTGKYPRLRECVEHFDGRTLNVMLCLGELPAGVKEEIRQAGREERRAKR